MSDVIWAAIIAVLGSGLTGGIAARATYWVAKRSSDTAIATADKQAEVELAKVQGELDRLREQQRQAERSSRQGTYQRTLAVLDRLDMFATGYNPEREADHMAALEELNNMIGGIHRFGAQAVRDALSPLSEALERLGAHISKLQREAPGMPYAVAYGAAYRSRREEMTDPAAHLTEAMRDDVTREILE
jgi:hypothetical protein